MRYVGWIKASPNQRHKLLRLGVEGRIKYNQKEGCFEYCNCSYDIIKRLIREFEGFWPQSFTAIDLEKKKAPRHMQFAWYS